MAYVDFIRGSKGDCGSVKTPCKYLVAGLEKVSPNGKVMIIGEQALITTAKLNKNVSVEAGKGIATITNQGNNTYAFEM